MVAPAARRSLGERARTVPCVPTGMKSGVSTVPWGRVRVPARAEPEVASSVNSNTCVIADCGLDARPSNSQSEIRSPQLQDRHRVPIAVEPIPLLDRVSIGSHHLL